MTDVSRILLDIEQGDAQAAEQLLPLVYEELRELAAQKLAHERPGQTLQATALVHEAYLRLVAADSTRGWDNSGHFFAAAAEAMRRILVNRARDKGRLKRGGGQRRVDFDLAEVPLDAPHGDLVALDEALEKLEREDASCAALVKLRFFAGLTQEEAARSLGIGRRTADRHWAYAKAWLYHELRQGDTQTH
jgi:RNA polymerase sigma factor (TIGR02999 family)